jgi:hypothetical protein
MPDIKGYFVELSKNREYDSDISVCSQYKMERFAFRSVLRVYGEGFVRIGNEDKTLKTAKLMAAALNAAMLLERRGIDSLAYFEKIT